MCCQGTADQEGGKRNVWREAEVFSLSVSLAVYLISWYWNQKLQVNINQQQTNLSRIPWFRTDFAHDGGKGSPLSVFICTLDVVQLLCLQKCMNKWDDNKTFLMVLMDGLKLWSHNTKLLLKVPSFLHRWSSNFILSRQVEKYEFSVTKVQSSSPPGLTFLSNNKHCVPFYSFFHSLPLLGFLYAIFEALFSTQLSFTMYLGRQAGDPAL